MAGVIPTCCGYVCVITIDNPCFRDRAHPPFELPRHWPFKKPFQTSLTVVTVMDVGRMSARVVPERPSIAMAKSHSVSFKQKARDVSQTDSCSVTSGADKARKVFVLGEMRSKRMLQGSNSSFLSEAGASKGSKKYRKFQASLLAMMENRYMSLFMTVVTIYALFGDDIRLSNAPASADPVFYSISLAVMIVYSLEIIIHCISKAGYIGSFYFWLDLLSTASLLMDVGWSVARCSPVLNSFSCVLIVWCVLVAFFVVCDPQGLEFYHRFRC